MRSRPAREMTSTSRRTRSTVSWLVTSEFFCSEPSMLAIPELWGVGRAHIAGLGGPHGDGVPGRRPSPHDRLQRRLSGRSRTEEPTDVDHRTHRLRRPPSRPVEIAPDTFVVQATQGEGVAPVAVHLNAMVIRGAEPIIVDTGVPALRDRYLEDMWSLVDPEDVRWVFLSHDDIDHFGNLEAVMAACPNATLLTSWFQWERMGNLPLPPWRMRWLEPTARPSRPTAAPTPPSARRCTTRPPPGACSTPPPASTGPATASPPPCRRRWPTSPSWPPTSGSAPARHAQQLSPWLAMVDEAATSLRSTRCTAWASPPSPRATARRSRAPTWRGPSTCCARSSTCRRPSPGQALLDQMIIDGPARPGGGGMPGPPHPRRPRGAPRRGRRPPRRRDVRLRLAHRPGGRRRRPRHRGVRHPRRGGRAGADPVTDGWPLGLVREVELCQAASVLGVDEVVLLDYRDSGFAGEPHPRALVDRAARAVADELRPAASSSGRRRAHPRRQRRPPRPRPPPRRASASPRRGWTDRSASSTPAWPTA